MFLRTIVILGHLLVIIGSSQCLEECDVTKQRRCRHSVVEELDKQSRAQSTHELEFHCRRLRENLNCLALQVTQCSAPNRSGDLIFRAWKYLQKTCDTYGGWWDYECFHLEDTKKCEKIFALRDGGVSQTSCREYDRFRHCISDVLKKHCDAEDVLSVGNYLLDKASDMIWTCPHGSPKLKSPIVDTGFVGLDRAEKPFIGVDRHDKHLSERDRHLDRAETPFTGVDRHDKHLSERDRTEKSYVALEQHRVPLIVDPLATGISGKYEKTSKITAEESHLRGVYSSALTADSPFVTGCNARATEEMRGCLDRHQYERDQALGTRESEDRLRKTCCATWNYRRCVQNAVRIHCYDTRQVDVQSASDVIPHDRDFLCREHWIYTCSGACNISPRSVLFALVTAVAVYLKYGIFL